MVNTTRGEEEVPKRRGRPPSKHKRIESSDDPRREVTKSSSKPRGRPPNGSKKLKNPLAQAEKLLRQSLNPLIFKSDKHIKERESTKSKPYEKYKDLFKKRG